MIPSFEEGQLPLPGLMGLSKLKPAMRYVRQNGTLTILVETRGIWGLEGIEYLARVRALVHGTWRGGR